MKWGALAHLTNRFGLRSILQVAYLRDGEKPFLTTDVGTMEVPGPVWQHFANLKAIAPLASTLQVEIKVYDDVFDHRNRASYLAGVLRYAESCQRPRLVFLDPDTGVEPGALKAEHASLAEVRALWAALRHGEVLAVYQHAAREANWMARSAQRIADACGGANVRSVVGNVAADVAIFWGLKESV